MKSGTYVKVTLVLHIFDHLSVEIDVNLLQYLFHFLKAKK